MIEDEYVKNMEPKFKRKWANRWQVVSNGLQRETPWGFVTSAVNAYLQEGKVPDDPRILDLVQRIDYWLKLQAEAKAKKQGRAEARVKR